MKVEVVEAARAEDIEPSGDHGRQVALGVAALLLAIIGLAWLVRRRGKS